MSWQGYICIQILFGFGIARPFQKKAADSKERDKLLVWKFLHAAVLSSVFYLASASAGGWWHPQMALVTILGILNGVANHYHWKAMRVSLTKTSALKQFEHIIAIVLAFVFLGEYRLLFQPRVALGLVLCLLSAWLFATVREESKVFKNLVLLSSVLKYSLLWGVAIFAMRFVALERLPVVNYLFAWYGPSFFTVLVIFAFQKNGQLGLRVPKQESRWALLAGISIWLAQFAAYRAKQLAPVTVSQPLVMVADMLIPGLFGWYFFQEGRQFSRTEKFAALVGLAGGVVLALGF